MNINLTREELDKLIKSNDLERYTQQQFKQFVESNEEVLIKGEKGELDDIEKSEYDTLIAELQSFTTVNVFDYAPESKNRIIKSIEFVRPKQVEWDEIEKSEEDLSKARAGIYTDTSLNRKLGRVGQKYGSKKQSTDGSDDEGKFRKERSQAHIDSIKRSIKQLEDRQKTHKLSEIESKALENYKKDLLRAEDEGKSEMKEAVYQGPVNKYREKIFSIKKESDGSNTVIIDEKDGRKLLYVPDSDLRFVDKKKQSGEKPEDKKKSNIRPQQVNVAGEDYYKVVHGKSPNSVGEGTWIFSSEKRIDDFKDKSKYTEVKGTYLNAKQKAKKWAAEQGHKNIFVQT